MQGVQNCLDNKVMTGVCTSLCQSNYEDLLTEKWVDVGTPERLKSLESHLAQQADELLS